MSSNIDATGPSDPLHSTLTANSDHIYLTHPTTQILQDIVTLATPEGSEDTSDTQHHGDHPGQLDGDTGTIHIMGDAKHLRTLRDNFPLASSLADLTERGALSIGIIDNVESFHSTGSSGCGSTVASEDSIVAALPMPSTENDGRLLLDSTEDGDVKVAYEALRSIWTDAEPFSLRTPGRRKIQETLTETFDAEIAADYLDLIDEIDKLEEIDADSASATTMAILVAAKHGCLLYDIGRWSEDVGLASRATVSRDKQRLVDRGFIQTEKVPVDVGRPRLRLQLDPAIQSAEPADLAGLIANEIAD